MNDQELETRLREWAAAFGGEQMRRTGAASSERLGAIATDDLSSAPPSAVEIERIVQCMEHAGRWREGRVLRVQYFCPDVPEAERLRRLNRIGLGMSRAAYYIYLGAARSFALGAMMKLPERRVA